MRTPRVKLLLWSAAALAGAAAALAVVAALVLPLDLAAPASHGPTAPALPRSDRTEAVASLASFKRAGDRKPRRPLADPPPAVPVITPAQVAAARATAARPPVRLAGTVRDGATGRPRGLFVTAGGKV